MRIDHRPSFARCYQAIPEIWRGGWSQRALLHQATVALTDAQIKALPTTAIEIIPATASKMSLPCFSTARLEWTADYTNIDGAAQLLLRTGGNSFLAAIAREGDFGSVSSLLAGGESVTSIVTPVAYTGTSNETEGVPGYYNTDIGVNVKIVALNGAAGDFTGGNAANLLHISTVYYLLNLTTGLFE